MEWSRDNQSLTQSKKKCASNVPPSNVSPCKSLPIDVPEVNTELRVVLQRNILIVGLDGGKGDVGGELSVTDGKAMMVGGDDGEKGHLLGRVLIVAAAGVSFAAGVVTAMALLVAPPGADG